VNVKGYDESYIRVTINPGYIVTVNTNAAAVQSGEPVHISGRTMDYDVRLYLDFS
jgi:hypothetical protein